MNPTDLALFPEPGFSAYEWRPWFRNRRICFIMEDWRRVGEALQAASPGIRYMRGGRPTEIFGATPPPIQPGTNLCEIVQEAAEKGVSVSIVFDTDWYYEPVPPGRDRWWTQKYRNRLPLARIRSTSRIYPAGPRAPEHVYDGDISFSVEPKNQQQVAFMRAFWSLLGKFSSNRNQVEVTYPGYEYFNPKTVTNLWIGHEAARWARDNPGRLLDYKQIAANGPILGAGLRPVEKDWPERRKQALGAVDPETLKHTAEPLPVEEYSSPMSARQAVIRRATRGKEPDGTR